MGVCNVEVVKRVAKYLNVSTGTTCYNTEKVLTSIIDKEDVEGFATIILRLASKSGAKMTDQQTLLSYQWLEFLALYADQAALNPILAKTFLQDLNRYLTRNNYLTGQHITVTDVAAYHVLYSLLEKLTVAEQESMIALCRWFKHVQTKPQVTAGRTPLPLETLYLSVTAPAVH